MLTCLFNRTLKRKYNKLNTKFKDLKESKVAKLDAKAQYNQLNTKLNTKFKDLKSLKQLNWTL